MATKILEVTDVNVIRAAGGLVLRKSRSGETEIAVIHRPAYDDWTFPKGKVEPDESPEDCALRSSEFRRLASLLEQLSERERELIALKYGAEVNNRAIARITGLGESNVGTILHRTVQSLRARWYEKEEEGP